MSSITTASDLDSSSIWRYPSITSSPQSNMTSSSGVNSLLSMDSSFERDGIPTAEQLSFIAQRPDHFYQLMDDLAIIDEIYQTFGDEEVESEPYERQVADAARNVAQKLHVVNQMCQSEEQHINELESFLFYYLDPIDAWIIDPANTEIFQKYPGLCSEKALIELFQVTKQITKAHQQLFRELRERLEMWGPTQFVSDIFSNFFERTSVYEKYFNICPSTIVTIDTLYKKSSSFTKFIESCVGKANIQPIRDIIYYLRNPLLIVSTYHAYLVQLISATDPSHPDYRALLKMEEKFAQRELEWKAIIKDRLAHIRVLEASRSIQDNPAIVTTARRLFISGQLTRVDITNPQSNQDTRTHLLYNDIFMYCQKIKQSSFNNKKTANTTDRLVFKGIINLRHADITLLSSENIAKITKIRKPTTLSFMRKSSSEPQTLEVPPPAYGFEIHANETSLEGMTALRGDGLSISSYTVPGHKAGNGSKRVYIMRTQTEAEQNAWISLLKKVSLQMTRKR